MRFHLVAAFYVLLFSLFYSFSAAQYALLFFLIAAVIAAELFNTAIENVCDLISKETNERIRVAKDVGAGAVLVLAIGAAAVAVVFFLDFEVIPKIFSFFAQNIPLLILLIISAAGAVFFVRLGPLGIAEKLRRKKK